MRQYPLIVIVGPTGSGKSSLAFELAKSCGGEIICADSRTIFKGMDLGTAKPTEMERSLVPHWGLDLVEPGESYNASDFKSYATSKIKEIRERGNTPFLVGGTGLYIDAVLFDYEFGTEADIGLRKRLERLTINELQVYSLEHNITLPKNSLNKRHMIGAIEREGRPQRRTMQPLTFSNIVGISTSKEELARRIRVRAEHIFKSGVVEETTRLESNYGWQSEAMTANIYPLIKRFMEGSTDLKTAIDEFITTDKHLAKRQLTWLRRNPYIMWLPLDEASSYIRTVLAGE